MSTKRAVFKPDLQNQGLLFPPHLADMVPPHHKSRLISQIIDGMNIDSILSTYLGGGSSAYSPRMLLKVLVYAYSDRVYSSRSIEKACYENVCYMWLSGMSTPDHNTINNFRKHRMGGRVKEVFAHVLLTLHEQGYVKLDDYFLDGTILESVASRYTFVWKSNVERYKKSVLDKVAMIVSQVDALCEKADKEDEDAADGDDQGDKLSDSVAVQETIDRLNKALDCQSPSTKEEAQEVKKAKTKLKNLENQSLPKLKEYERQQEILGDRSSFSKTDPDATFMRPKDDHFGNGQLKPGYNAQVGTENHFVVNWTMHQTPADNACFIAHLDDTESMLARIGLDLPKSITADAGYGNEETYRYCEGKEMEAYLKYTGYYKEEQGALKAPFAPSQLYYNEELNVLICPMGQHMTYCGEGEEKTASGYTRKTSRYKAVNCAGCPLRGMCHKQDDNRVVTISHKGQNYRQQARARLSTKEGRAKCLRRNAEVEGFFGNLKANLGRRRFTLKGLTGVNIEMGLLSIATNLRRLHKLSVEQGSSLLTPVVQRAKMT